jgi:hypothetical protein
MSVFFIILLQELDSEDVEELDELEVDDSLMV